MIKNAILDLAGVPRSILSDFEPRLQGLPVEPPVERMQEIDSLVQRLDLEALKAKVKDKNGWTEKQADTSELWYRRFLSTLKRHPHAKLVPTDMIDEFWHAHILDTRKYAEDCQMAFGRFIHHRPSYNGGKDIPATAGENTCMLFLKEYGELPPLMNGGGEFWPCFHKCSPSCDNPY